MTEDFVRDGDAPHLFCVTYKDGGKPLNVVAESFQDACNYANEFGVIKGVEIVCEEVHVTHKAAKM